MVNLGFSIYDLEYFLLIFVRISCFIYIAPFWAMSNTPARVRVGLSFMVSLLLYQVLTPAPAVIYDSVMAYALIVMKEAIVGLLLGFGASICMSILNFAGHLVDMEIGLSMVTLMDPATKQNTSMTGVLYQYIFTMLMIVTGMYRYLMSAVADSFDLIPVNGAIFRAESLLDTMLTFLSDYIIIGFRIILPVFCVILLLNAVLGVLAKVAPQMNMFSVGIQLKILVGLGVIFFTIGMLPGAADFIFQEMKKMMLSFTGGMM